MTLPPPIGDLQPRPRRDLRPIILPVAAAVVLIWLTLSFWQLNRQDHHRDERLDQIETGIGALSTAIDDIRQKFPLLPIESPEQILEDAAVDITVPRVGPQGEPGVQGEQGVPGRSPTADEIAAAVEDYCAEHDGCAGPSGTGGTAPTAAQLAAAVTDYCTVNDCIGPQGAVGPPGRSPTTVEIVEAVAAYCSSGVCVGPPGATGAPGADGSDGATGSPGPAGPGLPVADGEDAREVVDIVITCGEAFPHQPVQCSAQVIYGS